MFYVLVWCSVVFFFFKQKTAYEMRISDWSSDVCSSDLPVDGHFGRHRRLAGAACAGAQLADRLCGVRRAGRGQRAGMAKVPPGHAGQRPADAESSRTFVRRASVHVESDRKSVGKGQGVSVRVDIGGRGRIIKKKKETE